VNPDPTNVQEAQATAIPAGRRGLVGGVERLRELVLNPRVLIVGSVVILVVLALMPWLLTGFWVRVLTSVFMFGALAQSVNIIAGFAGRADFGNVVYFGLGAYTTGFLMRASVPFPLAIAGGAILCISIAILIGWPVLRLKGHYFAIATIGIMEGTRQLVNNMGFLGGGGGLVLPVLGMDPSSFSAAIYYAMLGLMVAYTLLVFGLARSSLGYGLRAIKADEQAAAVMGINTTRSKTLAWATSAGCTAIVGGVYVLWFGFISPDSVFDIVTGTEYFMMMLIGGAGTVFGPILGAAVLETLQVTVWSNFQHGHLAILGLLIVLVVVFMPNGVIHAIRYGRLGR
jgi:branched-chain amino acid transport system permease protein